MEGDWILNLDVWSRIEGWLRPSQIQSETIIPETVRLRQLNDQLFEVFKAAETSRPSLEIVFFHGLQVEVSSKPYLTTWLSRDNTELWLNWLRDDIRILIVSYDASAKRTETKGRMDMHITCENLLKNLTDKRARVGQGGYPVILVGHCLGGLVLKEVCVKASSMTALMKGAQAEKLTNFLDSVKGVFFYATPHHGAILPNMNASSSSGSRLGPLFKDLPPLNEHTARRNQDFSLLRQTRKWKAAGVGEGYGVSLESFRGFVIQVPEASSRDEVDEYYTVPADHFEITRPKDKTSASFTQLSDFINQIQPEGQPQLSGRELSVPEHIVGMKTFITNFITRLRSTNCRRWGVVGMGGMGKTTLANILYKNISNRFQYASFVHDVKGLMGDDNQKQQDQNVQKFILNNLITRSGNKIDPESFQWERLRNENVMIVLDDVERDFHVEFTEDKIWNIFSKESLIIVTTRNRRLLESNHFQIYDMEALGESDAKRLLCLKAFQTAEVPMGFDDHVRNIMLKCGNLPLALEVVGKSLYERDEAAWVAMCETISGAESINGYRNDGLWSVLRRSYDSLPDKEREMFLDIAVCFHGEVFEEVSTAWKFIEWGSPDLGWQNLLDRLLVKIEYGRILMHELLRDLGRSIACSNQPDNLLAYTRLAYSYDWAESWMFYTEMVDQVSRTEGSRMKLWYTPEHGLQCHGQLHGLRDLRALWCSGDGVFKHLPDTFDCVFPPQLTYLNIIRAGSMAMMEVCRVRGLRCLIFKYGVGEIPSSLGQLIRLKYLEMCSCTFQVIPEEIGNLCELQHLTIDSCIKLSVIPAEIGQLHKLQHFEISHCDSVGVIPAKIGQLSKLRRFRIEKCGGLKSLPFSIAQLRALQDVTIKRCMSLQLPLLSFGDLRTLREVDCQVDGVYETLVTNRCSRYEVRSSVGFGWTKEELLSMRHVRDKGGIPTHVRVRDSGEDIDFHCSLDSIAEASSACKRWPMQSLRIVDVIGDIDKVCHMFRHTSRDLQTLEILHCPNVAELHFFGQHLFKLRRFYMQNLPLLKTLSNTFVELRALEFLKLENLPLLAQLPKSISDLRALKILELEDLPLLAQLPKSIGDLRALEILGLKNLPLLAQLPKSIGDLRALKILKLEDLPRLALLPTSVGGLSALEILELSGLPSLDRLPKSVDQLQALRGVKITGYKVVGAILEAASSGHLSKLKHVSLDLSGKGDERQLSKMLNIERLGALAALEQLELTGCPGLVSPVFVGHFRSLKVLIFDRCDELLELPESVGHLPALEYLEIRGCKKLTKLKGSVGQVRALERLLIAQCPHAVEIVHSIMDRGSVKGLTMEFWNALPASVGQLCTLEHLDLERWQSESLPQSIGEFCGLKHLTMEGCKNLMQLPKSIGQLCGIESLRIERCNNFKELPQSIEQLGSLRHVAIKWCAPETSLAASLAKLPALEDLEIDRKIWANLAEHLGRFPSLKRLTVDTSVFSASSEYAYINDVRPNYVAAFLDGGVVPEFPQRLGGLEQLIWKSQCDMKGREYARWKSDGKKDELWERAYERAVIKKLPKSVGELHALKYLEVSDCGAITELPVTIGKLSRLEKISVRRCRKLELWRPSVEHLQHVQELQLVYENPKRRCEGSFLTTVLRRQDLLALTREGRSLLEVALMVQEKEEEKENPVKKRKRKVIMILGHPVMTEEEESDL